MPDSVEMDVSYLLSHVNGFALKTGISLFQTKFTCRTFAQVRLALDQEYFLKFGMSVLAFYLNKICPQNSNFFLDHKQAPT